MNRIDWDEQQVSDAALRDRLNSTVNHTLRTISAADALFSNQALFQTTYGADVSQISAVTDDFQSIVMLMFVHDFFKLKEQNDHASKGADFLEAADTTDLIRYHDKLGIIHTGEASLLFLADLVKCAESMSPDVRKSFLRKLLVLTIVDVASTGYLNQLRVDTYHEVVGMLDRAAGGEDLTRIARDDTPQRIHRLICSNNRFSVQPEVVNDRLQAYADRSDLFERLLYLRFDAGVYVLEPLLRYMVGKHLYRMASKEVISLDKSHAEILDRWIISIHRLLHRESKSHGHLEMLNLNDRSIKEDKHLDAFERWAKDVEFAGS
jgi:hypothetical protein